MYTIVGNNREQMYSKTTELLVKYLVLKHLKERMKKKSKKMV